MGVSFRSITGGGDRTRSMRGTALSNNLPPTYDPFTFRELITPQYREDAVDGQFVWSNWVGDHAETRIRHTPTSRRELVGAVVSMAREGGEMRAVGAGHSHSSAPAPRSHYIDLSPGETEEGSVYSTPRGLNRVLDHNGWLRDGVDEAHLKRLQAGVTLRRLNRYILHPGGYALHNMGSFDGQTVAGAVNTSTHGTGIDLAAVSDSVRSVELVTMPASKSGEPIVRLYRIEPTDGITDRQAFEAETNRHRSELIQNDDIFHAVVVGYGCMGVAYAYTLDVRDAYWLHEESTLMKWSTVRSQLGDSPESVREFATKDGTRHLQILVNTAAVQTPEEALPFDDHDIDGDPICLVRRHYEVDSETRPGNWGDRWPPERLPRGVREFIQDVANMVHPLKPNEDRAQQLHNRFFHPEASDAPFVGDRRETAWYVALRRIPDEGDGGDEYYEPLGPLPTPTTEVAVPLENLAEAVDAVLERVQTITQEEPIPGKNADGQGRDVFFAVPMGLRFTHASEHFLSPEFERTSAMVELPLSVNEGTTKATLRSGVPDLTQAELREYVVEPALTKVERLLVEEYDGRPHMGKHNTVTAAELDARYPFFDASDAGGDAPRLGWYQLYEHFNAFGVFDNAFTDQLGLAEFAPAAPTPADPIGLFNPSGGSGAAESDDADERDESTDDDAAGSLEGVEVDIDLPGFGVLPGAAGVGAAAWWLRRRSRVARGDEATDDPSSDETVEDTTSDEATDDPSSDEATEDLDDAASDSSARSAGDDDPREE